MKNSEEKVWRLHTVGGPGWIVTELPASVLLLLMTVNMIGGRLTQAFINSLLTSPRWHCACLCQRGAIQGWPNSWFEPPNLPESSGADTGAPQCHLQVCPRVCVRVCLLTGRLCVRSHFNTPSPHPSFHSLPSKHPPECQSSVGQTLQPLFTSFLSSEFNLNFQFDAYLCGICNGTLSPNTLQSLIRPLKATEQNGKFHFNGKLPLSRTHDCQKEW